VLEHIYNFENFFKESLRVLKPNGKVVITTPFFHRIHNDPEDYYRFGVSFYNKVSLYFNQSKLVELSNGPVLDSFYIFLFNTFPTPFANILYLFFILPFSLLQTIGRLFFKSYTRNTCPLGYLFIGVK
jgi:SAM-dependent methyltransferase